MKKPLNRKKALVSHAKRRPIKKKKENGSLVKEKKAKEKKAINLQWTKGRERAAQKLGMYARAFSSADQQLFIYENGDDKKDIAG